jgi:2-phospho-L-lactate guanylyltransferase
VSHTPTVIIPIRDFAGMTRLSGVLDERARAELGRELAARAIAAAKAANLDVTVVSSSPHVTRWSAMLGVAWCPDPGGGLSATAAETVASLRGDPWIVLHADLPLVNAHALSEVAHLSAFRTVLVPSHDGGTNVIAAEGDFPFAYGPGSFHRHFSAVPDATIVSNPELSIDIDTPLQLSSFPELLDASTLRP